MVMGLAPGASARSVYSALTNLEIAAEISRLEQIPNRPIEQEAQLRWWREFQALRVIAYTSAEHLASPCPDKLANAVAYWYSLKEAR